MAAATTHASSELLAGAFELEEVIGQGGMAEVWRGRHVGQDVRVAVKLMDAESMWEREGLSTFQREVQSQAALHHPAVLRIYESGRISEATIEAFALDVPADNPFLVMEYGPDGTLADHDLDTWPACRAFLTTVLDALAHAHSRGLIHRDLKPHNILRFPDDDATWKLADFGLAHAADRNVGRDDRTLQDPDAGTPLYMAPEQLRGEWRHFGPWTDLYQLGCIAFELITGSPPFTGGSLIEIATGHMDEPVPEIHPRMAIPEPVREWITGMMQTSPADRFRRAADAAHALQNCETDGGPFDDTADDDPPSPTQETDEIPEMAETLGEAVPATLPAVGIGETKRWGPTEESQDFDAAVPEPDPDDEAPTLSTRPVPFEAVRNEWDARDWIPPDVRFADVGLGLFGVREVPFVDRKRECETLWETLERAVDDHEPNFTVIEGESGIGKSRLAEWIAQRSHELGACTVLRATHDRQGGPTTGIRGMLERWFDTHGLDRESVWKTVRMRFVELARRRDESVDRRVEDEARGLTELLRPEDEQPDHAGGPSYQFGSRTEKLVLLVRVLQRIAAQRPLFIWLDDVHWSRNTFDLVEHLAALDSELTALVALTIRTDEIGEAEVDRSSIDALQARDHAVEIDIGGLAPDDQATLVDRMLGLESELAERVCRRTEGNPLFAVQLVGDWVSRGLLEPGADGFQLVEDAEDEVPDEIRDLWERRLDRVLADLPDGTADDVGRALELAAALGRHFDRREWFAACRAAGVVPPSDVVDEELVGRGLVEREEDAWQFVHSMLVETLLEQARENDREAENHHICAEMLRDVHADRRGAVAEREAEHWLGAGERDRAMDALLLGARHTNDHGDFEGAKQMLDRFDALAERQGAGDEDRRVVETWSIRAHNHFRCGNIEEALKAAQRAETAAREHDWPELLGEALLVSAGVRHRASKYPNAIELLDDAQEAFERAGDREGVAKCLRRRSLSYNAMGNYDEAVEALEEARAHFSEIGDEMGMLRCGNGRLLTWVQEGDYEAAEKTGQQLIDRASELGAVDIEESAWNGYGDAARLRGDQQAARDRYEQALRLIEMTGSANDLPVQLNLAMTQLAAGEFDDARRRFERLIDALSDAGFLNYLPHAHLGRAAAAAARGDVSSVERALGEFQPAFNTSDHPDPDLAWLAVLGARLAERADLPSYVEQFADLAVQICDQLAPTDRTLRVREELAELRGD